MSHLDNMHHSLHLENLAARRESADMKLSLDNRIWALQETVNFLEQHDSSADEDGDKEARLLLAKQLEKRWIKLAQKRNFLRRHATPRP